MFECLPGYYEKTLERILESGIHALNVEDFRRELKKIREREAAKVGRKKRQQDVFGSLGTQR